MLEMVTCPEILDDDSHCDLPARITRRDVLESTDGPIEHVSTSCLGGHVLSLFPVAMLEARASVPAPELGADQELHFVDKPE